MPHCFKLARRLSRLRHLAFAGAVVAFAACSEALSPTDEAAIPAAPLAAPVGLGSTFDAPLPAASTAGTSHSGIPFGFFSGDYYELGSTWTSTRRGASTSSIRRYLEVAQQRHARVFIQFSGGNSNYRNSDGTFSLTKWKAAVAKYRNIDLREYIADGTLAAHYLIDEPNDGSNWDGNPVPYRHIEAMAQYSKELFPGLKTVVRVVPTWLAGASFRWEYLDAAWAQYSARKGEAGEYREAQVNAAKAEGLGLVFGLNVLDGGDGSSGWLGTKTGKYNMSPAELLRYGSELIGSDYACGFLMWKYTESYLARGRVLTSLQTLSALAKAHPNTSCRQ